MTFVEAFLSFNFEIINPERGLFEKIRFKTPRHPDEPLSHFYARLVAFAHAYEEGLAFSRGLFEPAEPAIWRKDSLANLITWIEVGDFEPQKLSAALRSAENAGGNTRFSAYFYEERQLLAFRHGMRNIKSPWRLQSVNFYMIQTEDLARLFTTEQSSSQWLITIADNILFMVCNGAELTVKLDPIDLGAQCLETGVHKAAPVE